MIQEIELNGVKVKVEITKEMARKVLEESEEIEVGDRYYTSCPMGKKVEIFTFESNENDNFYLQHDDCLPCKSYTKQQAKEYFDKRDARRAAEYRIKKAIEKMNGDRDRDSEIVFNFLTQSLEIVTESGHTSCGNALRFNHSIGDYMLEHHTEDYKIFWGIE